MTDEKTDRVVASGSTAVGRTKVGARTVLTPMAALTWATVKDVESAFDEAVVVHQPEVILDMKRVTLMDSEALELLVRMHTIAGQRGGVLKLIHVNDVCGDILVATRLVNVLSIFDDLNMAIRSR